MADHSNESRILVVSRELSALRPLWAIGEANCWQIETAASGWEALDRVQSGTCPDVILKIGKAEPLRPDQLAGKPYLTGDKFTIADAYLFTVLRWSTRVNIDLGKWPNVKSYVDRVAARPKVHEAMKAEGLVQ